MIHERKAKALFSLGGGGYSANARRSGGCGHGNIGNVKSYRVLENGSVEAVLQNGQKVIVAQSSVVSTEGGIILTDVAAGELAAADAGAFGLAGGLGVGAGVGGAAVADYGWDQSFASQFDGVEIRDAVTDNLFSQVLQANDAGNTTDQVVSPVSALLASGLTDAEVRAAFDLPANIDLNTFNFYQSLSSPDPAIQAAAKAMSTAAVVAANVVKAALSAAGAEKALTAAEAQAVAVKAVADAAKVIKAMPASASVADIAEAASSVAVAGAMNANLDTDAAAKTLTDAVTAGQTVAQGVATTMAGLQALTDGSGLSAAQGDTAGAVATSVGTSAAKIKTLFDTLSVPDGATPEEIEAALKSGLDEASDEAESDVSDAINQKLLGINLAVDLQVATEGQVELLKGNVLQNDKFTDGTSLPATTSVQSVNGSVLPDNPAGTGSLASFVLSTSDWYTSTGRTVSVRDIAQELGLPGTLPRGAYTGGAATRGSAVVTEITVEAGTVLTFDYTFASRDYIPYNDYSFLAIHALTGGTADEQNGLVLRGEHVGAGGTMDVRDLKGPGFYTQAGYWVKATKTGYEYTFTDAGTFKIGIGVTDVRDTVVDSKMSVMDIKLVDANGTDIPVGNFTELGNVATQTVPVLDVAAGLITGNYGTLIIGKDGDYLYQLGGINADPIPEGVVVTDNFKYTVVLTDPVTGKQTIASQDLQIKVTGVADPVDGLPTVVLDVSDISSATASAAFFGGTATNADGGTVTLTLTDSNGKVVTVPGIPVGVNGSFQTTLDIIEGANELVDGPLTVSATVTIGTQSVTTSTTVLMDTDAEAEGALASVSPGTLTGSILEFTVDGVDSDATATITFTDGTNIVTKEVAVDGTFQVDLAGLNLGDTIALGIQVVDALGNEFDGQEAFIFQPTLSVDLPDQINAAGASAVVVDGTTNALTGTVTITVSDGTNQVSVSGLSVNANGTFSSTLDLTSLNDGPLQATAEVNVSGAVASTQDGGAMDTTGDDVAVTLLSGAQADALDVDGAQISLNVAGLENGSTAIVTFSDGTTTAPATVTADGKVVIDIVDFRHRGPKGGRNEKPDNGQQQQAALNRGAAFHGAGQGVKILVFAHTEPFEAVV